MLSSGIVLIIPMAGMGERFKKAGYQVPKYMIEVKGKTLFEHSLSSLPLELTKTVVFVGLKEHEDSYNLKKFINGRMKLISEEFKINLNYYTILLDSVTRGQMETVLKAKDYIDNNCDLAVYNVDTRFCSHTLREKLTNPELKKDGIIGAFALNKNDNKWSFAETDQKGLVIRTAEKQQISNYALTGFYHYSYGADYISAAEKCISECRQVNGEFYIAPMYNQLINEGKQYQLDIVETIIPLGTPEEVAQYAKC